MQHVREGYQPDYNDNDTTNPPKPPKGGTGQSGTSVNEVNAEVLEQGEVKQDVFYLTMVGKLMLTAKLHRTKESALLEISSLE